ncbi:MAG: hypothetical protein J5822_08535 [Eubacteriaceae bacterium]|nr:hypothetical protein [Eubacteriaceae bacterium]
MRRDNPYIVIGLGILSLASLLTGWYGAAVIFGAVFLWCLGDTKKDAAKAPLDPDKNESTQAASAVQVTEEVTEEVTNEVIEEVTEEAGENGDAEVIFEPEYTVIK